MGRRPKDKMVGDLPRSLVQSIDRHIDSHKNNSARSVYNKFGLADRGINERTFRLYVQERRESHQNGEPDDHETPIDPYARAMRLAIERIDAGDPKHLAGISSFLRALLDHRRVDLDEAADRRAAELHEVKMSELRKVQDKALTTTAQVKGLTPEQVAEIRLKVLGLA